MKSLLKYFVLFISLVIGQILAGMLTITFIPMNFTSVSDGPLDANQSLIVVSALYALTLGTIASRLEGNVYARIAVLFATIYGIEGIQGGVEAVYFNKYLKLPTNTILFIFVSNAIKSIFASIAAALLWRKNANNFDTSISKIIIKSTIIAAIYVVVYFSAGEIIAWQSSELRNYYSNGVSIDKFNLSILQLCRGYGWAALAALIVKTTSGSHTSKVLLVGAAFSTFLSVNLLFPVNFMPWDVRKMHMIEVGLSNFIFGIIAAAILLAPKLNTKSFK